MLVVKYSSEIHADLCDLYIFKSFVRETVLSRLSQLPFVKGVKNTGNVFLILACAFCTIHVSIVWTHHPSPLSFRCHGGKNRLKKTQTGRYEAIKYHMCSFFMDSPRWPDSQEMRNRSRSFLPTQWMLQTVIWINTWPPSLSL